MIIDPRPWARCVTSKRDRFVSISRTVCVRSLFALIVDPRRFRRLAGAVTYGGAQ